MTKYFVFVNITHKYYAGRAQFHMDNYVHIRGIKQSCAIEISTHFHPSMNVEAAVSYLGELSEFRTHTCRL